jgi:two-component system cell cycle sensor histidine kinase/response regulator CckA
MVPSHGGTIAGASAVGAGTRFRIALPAAGEEAAAESQIAGEIVGGFPSGKGERVLLVEDEAGARQGLAEILAMLGYEVVAAASAEDAAQRQRGGAQRFDLLLTDMMLPGKSGIDLAADLKERFPALKVILMSGYTEEVLRHRVQNGDARFLQKPFDIATLARAAREALNGETAAAFDAPPDDGARR